MSSSTYNAPTGTTIPGSPESKPMIPRWAAITIVVGAVVFLIAAVVGVAWLAINFPNQIEAMRDIFIMLFAITACASVIVLALLLVAVIRLINMLEFEIKPILEKTNETITMVQGTTAFVSTNVVRPAITARSYVSGFTRGIRVLFGNPKRNLPD